MSKERTPGNEGAYYFPSGGAEYRQVIRDAIEQYKRFTRYWSSWLYAGANTYIKVPLLVIAPETVPGMSAYIRTHRVTHLRVSNI